MNITKNPLIKIVGIIAIIYFALFHDTSHKDSLRNRLSTDNIKRNFSHIKNTTSYIKDNIENISGGKNSFESSISKLEKDLIDGDGEEVSCGDEIIINYIKSVNDKISSKSDYLLKIDDSKLSNKIIGMKAGGVRRIILSEEIDGENIISTFKVELIKIIKTQHNENDKKCS